MQEDSHRFTDEKDSKRALIEKVAKKIAVTLISQICIKSGVSILITKNSSARIRTDLLNDLFC